MLSLDLGPRLPWSQSLLLLLLLRLLGLGCRAPCRVRSLPAPMPLSLDVQMCSHTRVWPDLHQAALWPLRHRTASQAVQLSTAQFQSLRSGNEGADAPGRELPEIIEVQGEGPTAQLCCRHLGASKYMHRGQPMLLMSQKVCHLGMCCEIGQDSMHVVPSPWPSSCKHGG